MGRMVNKIINIINKMLSDQRFAFWICLIIFLVLAVLGWEKLQYGFNFIDEGYYMTESWRLAAGDHFLQDKFTGALRHYTLINSLIFRALPEITLLGFRQLQYGLTILSLIFFSGALYLYDKQYWYQPLIFSVFAFTGLDPIGMMSNFSYQTYPHLFIVLYLSCLLFGLFQENILSRRLLFIASGLFLWCISLSVLHMSLIVLSPVLLFLFLKNVRSTSILYDVKDVCFTLAPFILCWLVFLSIYNISYILNIMASAHLLLSSPTHSSEALIRINWEALKHIGISMLFLLVIFYGLKKLTGKIFILVLCLLSIVMYYIINTSLFGLIIPYYNGWFSSPMWFSSLIISFFIIFWTSIVIKIFKKLEYTKGEVIGIILLIPTSILALSSSIFSGLGVLTVLHSSIPVIAAFACVVLYKQDEGREKSYFVNLLILVISLAPFYFTTALSDWEFTFFDVKPSQANYQIAKGFGRGIQTNSTYLNLYNWIMDTAQNYSKEDDYIISYIVSPMVHMITQRRPALDDTFVSFGEVPMDYYEESIEVMEKTGRNPSMVFVFEGMAALWPVSMKDNKYRWFGKQFDFNSRAKDPISRYILKNMYFLDEFKINEQLIVKCFVDNKIDALAAKLHRDIEANPKKPSLHYAMGNMYMRKGLYTEAIESYKIVLSLKPDFVQALQHLAVAYSSRGDFEEAISSLQRIIEIQPDNTDALYNITCIYARQNKVADAISWLKKAVDKGFQNWDLLKNDNDLENIRGDAYYRDLIKNH